MDLFRSALRAAAEFCLTDTRPLRGTAPGSSKFDIEDLGGTLLGSVIFGLL